MLSIPIREVLIILRELAKKNTKKWLNKLFEDMLS